MRNGIVKLLPWAKLGISYVDTAGSGSKALQKMEEHMPDIVLTDIEMSQMDGLELIRNMNRRNPRLRIIVLTGHDNFSYVQECCRMEVHDYYLKPIEPEILTKAIQTQLEALKRLSQEEDHKKTIVRVNALENQIRVERAFHAFMRDGSGIREIKEILDEYGFRSNERLQLALIIPEELLKSEWIRHHELMGLSVSSLCMEMVEYDHHGITFRDELGSYVLVMFCGEDHPDIREITEQLHTILLTEYNMEQSILFSPEISDLARMPDEYRAMLHRRDEGQIIGCAPARIAGHVQRQVYRGFIEYQQKIAESFGDKTQALSLFTDWCDLLGQSRLPLGKMRQLVFQFLSGIYYTWDSEVGAKTERGMEEVAEALQFASQKGICETGRKFLENLIGSSRNLDEDVTETVKRYINHHLNQPLSVTELANMVYLSVPYFSKLFKKKNGVGCNYYIVQQRMERAKSLLRNTTMKVSLVAEKVGYGDIKYFSLTFKKYTGCAPAEYRDTGQEVEEICKT